MTDKSDDGLRDISYAEPHEPLDYEAFRQSYVLPDWKDTRKLHKKQPVRDLGGARLEHKHVYYSREAWEREWEHLWSKVWLHVGHLSDIPRANCFMKVDRGPESVLIVRGEGDEVKGMYNVCQHRGARLVVQDFGSTQKFVCPFHRWEFAVSGELLKIQDRESFREDSLCYNLDLPPVRTAVWRGWIFMTLDDNAPSLETFLGDELIARTSAYDFENVLRIRDVQQEWPANWKTAHEAFVEGYHVQATHPQLYPAVNAYHAQTDLFDNGHALSIYQFMSPSPQYVSRLTSELAEEHKIFLREAGIQEADFPKHWSEVPEAIIKAKKARKDYVIDYDKFSEGQLIDDWGLGLFPTTEMFLHPEGFFVQQWLPHPTDPEKCIYHVQVYAVPGIGELPSFMAVENADMSGKKVLPRTYADPDDIDVSGPVVKQDRVLVPRVQSGLHSKGYKGGVYSDQEIRIRHFFEEYFKHVGPC
jgi:phenylpropionate dioxygenase-like ring-hydroxylating dioxygenase large terminal subunit